MQRVADDTKERTESTKFPELRPKLFEIDPILNAIFIYCTEVQIIHIHETVLFKQYKQYWQSSPVVIMFEMTSLLTADILCKLCDILEILKENLTTIAIRIHFDLFMNHIDYDQVAPFFNQILLCAQTHSLWRLRLIIKYKHCDVDFKWHQLSQELIASLMMLQLNKTNKFRKSRTIRLSLRVIDFILFWKLHHQQYKLFLNNLTLSTAISQLQIEFASLYKVHSNYSYIISNLFDAISKNVSISGLSLKNCADSNLNYTRNDEDLASLLSNNNNDNNNDRYDHDGAYLSYIYNCFKSKKIDVKYGGNNACWKQQSFYKFSCSEKDFSLRINSKYGIYNILSAIQENENLCLNCLVLENVIYDHEENKQIWEDPFQNAVDTVTEFHEVNTGNIWKALLEICTSNKHFVEILEFAESKIGKTYCEDLQRFMKSIIYGNKLNKNDKKCHIRKFKMCNISSHGTDVFIEYMVDLMKNGLSYNPMMAEIKIEFDYIGNLKIFETKFTKLIGAALSRIKAMIESQFAIEEYLCDEMGFSFGIIQLILQLTRFQKISFEINEGKSKFFVENAAEKVRFSKVCIKSKMSQLKQFDNKYKERNINKYLRWQYKDILDNDKQIEYKPSFESNILINKEYGELMSKYMKLICAGDVCLEIGYKSLPV